MPPLSRGDTWGPLPRCLQGCWVKEKDEHQLLPMSSITLELQGEAVPTPPTSRHFRGPGGFLDAELTHLHLLTRLRTLPTAQTPLVCLPLTWGSHEAGLGIGVVFTQDDRAQGGNDFPQLPPTAYRASQTEESESRLEISGAAVFKTEKASMCMAGGLKQRFSLTCQCREVSPLTVRGAFGKQ